jgi:hypothetical protein
MENKVEAALNRLRQLHEVILTAEPSEARAALAGVVKAVRVQFRPGGRTFELAAIDMEMADALVNLFNPF